jgi:hypothetical protein
MLILGCKLASGFKKDFLQYSCVDNNQIHISNQDRVLITDVFILCSVVGLFLLLARYIYLSALVPSPCLEEN